MTVNKDGRFHPTHAMIWYGLGTVTIWSGGRERSYPLTVASQLRIEKLFDSATNVLSTQGDVVALHLEDICI